MGVHIHRHPGIGVPHQILQALEIHSRIRHVGAEGVTQYMGRDGRQWDLLRPSVLLHCPLHVVIQVKTNLRIAVFVQQKEPGIAINQHFLFGLLPTGEDVLQTLTHFVRHGNVPHTAFGFGFLHMVHPTLFLEELLLHKDPTVLKVQVTDSQAAELANPHPRSQQYIELIIVPAVVTSFSCP